MFQQWNCLRYHNIEEQYSVTINLVLVNFKSCGEVVAVISESCSQKRGLSISTKGIDQGHPPAQSDLSCNFLLFVNVLQVQGPMYLMVSWLSNKIEVFGSLIKTTAVTKCDLTLY